MNREIKFRCWDINTMHYFDIADTITIDEDNVMQFTGLKDKSGVEIYEGDIVSVKSIIYDTDELYTKTRKIKFEIFCEVIWCKQIAGFDLKKIDGDNKPTAWGFYNENINPFEVIGNIFENENLIK